MFLLNRAAVEFGRNCRLIVFYRHLYRLQQIKKVKEPMTVIEGKVVSKIVPNHY